MVTPNSSMCVKSDAPKRPGGCCCAKNTSLAGPSVARQLFTRRCNVRNCPSSNWPGQRRPNCSCCSPLRPSSRLDDYPDHRDLEPLVPRTLPQRREAVHRRTTSYHVCLAWASEMPSAHRAVSSGHVATCCQCNSITSKYSVLASLRNSSIFCKGSTPPCVVTFDISR